MSARLLVVVLAVAVCVTTTPVRGQPAQAVERLAGIRGIAPGEVVPGQRFYLWGVTLAEVQATGPDGAPADLRPVPAQPRLDDTDATMLRAYQLHGPPGEYRLAARVGAPVTITVRAAPGPATQVVIPPGLHRWTQPMRLEPNTQVIAYGATIDAGGGDLFVLAPDCTVRGGHFTNFRHLNVAGAGSGVRGRIQDATFQDGALHGGSWSRAHMTIANCTFDRVGLFLPGEKHLTLENNLFRGVTEGHALQCWAAAQCAFLGNRFEGTDRGMVFQPEWGPVQDCLFFRNTYEDIDWVHNGNEVFLVELGQHPYRRNLDLHTRVRNCASNAIMLWGCQAEDNLWYELRADSSIYFGSLPGHPQGEVNRQLRNTFWTCELTNAAVHFGPNATHNLLEGCGFRGSYRGGRNAQHYYRVDFYTRSGGSVLRAKGPGNRAVDCAIIDRGPNHFAAEGFTLERVYIHPR